MWVNQSVTYVSELDGNIHHRDTERDRDCTEGENSFFARAKKEIPAAKRGKKRIF
jgi:hypothetical protein